MNTKSTFRTALFALAGGVLLLAPAGAASAQDFERLAQADANGDGAIAWQEMLDMRTAAFGRLDRNQDGFVDADDSPRRGPGKARFSEAVSTLQASDSNGDGRISRSEMLDAPAPLFEQGDTDGDKVLSADELASLRETASSN